MLGCVCAHSWCLYPCVDVCGAVVPTASVMIRPCRYCWWWFNDLVVADHCSAAAMFFFREIYCLDTCMCVCVSVFGSPKVGEPWGEGGYMGKCYCGCINEGNWHCRYQKCSCFHNGCANSWSCSSLSSSGVANEPSGWSEIMVGKMARTTRWRENGKRIQMNRNEENFSKSWQSVEEMEATRLHCSWVAIVMKGM